MFLKPIQVSPRSFKRQIETVLGALIQLRMPVTLFAKLPKGTSWFADLKQYSQVIRPHPDIFVWVREACEVPDWQQSILIPDRHSMQGEYFILAVSDTVSFLILGHREDTPAPASPRESR